MRRKPPAIRLEPLAPRHEARIRELVDDPEIAPRSELIPSPPDDARQFVRHAASLREQDRGWIWAITADGETVGVCGLERHPVERDRAELGYWIGRPYWRRGYATAAARQALRFGLREKGLSAIRARCLTDNEASQRVLEKAGMKRCGIRRRNGERPNPDTWLLVLELTAE